MSTETVVAEVLTKALEGPIDDTTAPPVHTDGVYFDLYEGRYHADRALGSSDMKRLFHSPPEYWFSSGWNDLREEPEPSEALIRGTAVHTFVLYGRETFEARYAPAWLNGSTKDGKVESEAIKASGRIRLKGKDYARIAQAGTIMRSNPFLREAFEGGRAEVSVFWTGKDGIRRKARFDFLKRRAIVDLKSIANTKGIDFERACVKAIEDLDYPVQAEHYREGREELARLVAEGCVHGNVDRDWLEKVAKIDRDAWAWVWVFWQSGGAPLTHSLSLSNANEICGTARVMLDQAAEKFIRYRDKFGMGSPWVLAEPTRELDVTELRYWGRNLLKR
jgi:hypothetical protein